MSSIGEILKQERTRRGGSIEEAHEATRITVQNLSALEEDKFDFFPNRVYARAFLRDYANYLGLDNASLLTTYEQEWGPAKTPETVSVRRGSPWKAVGYALLIVFVAAALGGVYYWGLTGHLFRPKPAKVEATASGPHAGEQAQLPKVPIVPGKPEAPKPAAPAKPVTKPQPPPQPKPQPKPVQPSTVKVEITAMRDIWAKVTVDGQSALPGKILPKGTTKVFEGKKAVFVREGMGDALQIKVNGQLQPPLGSSKRPAEKTFTLRGN